MLKEDSKLQVLTPTKIEVKVPEELKEDSKLQVLTPKTFYTYN